VIDRQQIDLFAREEADIRTPIAVLLVFLVFLVLLLLIFPIDVWLRHLPPVWQVANPPDVIRYCTVDYREPKRTTARAPSDPSMVEPVLESFEGARLIEQPEPTRPLRSALRPDRSPGFIRR
jgi:hypothetical protein